MKFSEKWGDSIDSAVELALADLNLTREEVKTIIFRYVYIYYNRVRVHTSNPFGLSPVKYREWATAHKNSTAA